MSDTKPPRCASDEAQTLHALLQYQRESLVNKVAGLTVEQARWSPVPSGTSLLWLVDHMATAEVTWVIERFAGTRFGTADHEGAPGDDLVRAVARYRATWKAVDDVVAGAGGLEQRCRGDRSSPPVNLRWVLAHLLEETARHAGHADIIRELLDGDTGR